MSPQKAVFCPICRSRRELPKMKIPRVGIAFSSVTWGGTAGVLLAILGSLEVGLFTGFLLGMLSFLLLEVYYTLKFKRELACPVCEFDPVLYRRSPEKAKERCLESAKQKPAALRKAWAEQVSELDGLDAFDGHSGSAVQS